MAKPVSKEDQRPPDLNTILQDIEKRQGLFDDHKVETEIRKSWQNFSEEKPPFEWLSEILAFQFMEEYPGNIEGYGDYFGPMMEATSNDGVPIRIPDAKLVNAEMLDYWAKRAKSTQHRVMAARYAGLVFDFSKVITGKAAPFKIAEIYFNNLLKISEDSLQEHEMEIVHKLERALHVAITMKNEDWLAKARKEILACQERINRDDAPGYWAMAYRLLIENKKSKLTEEEEKKIIEGLETRLSSLELKTIDGKIVDPWNFQSAAEPLADYYKRKGNKDDLERVVTTWGNAFEKAIESVSGMLASSWLQHAHEIYMSYGFRDKADKTAIKLREVGDSVVNELSEHTVEAEIPTAEIERIVNGITDKDIETALIRLALIFIPKFEKTREQLNQMYASHPVCFLFPSQIIDEKGRVVAVVGSFDADPMGHIVQQMTQDVNINSIYLYPVFEGIIGKFGLDTTSFMDFVSKSSVLKTERLSIIERGVVAFFDKDFFVAAHMLIPQIEEGIRNLYELFGGAVLKQRRSGGYHYKNLDELLREDIVKQVLGEDFAFYVQVILTDARGWNLRNDICHGLSSGISENQMQRIMHILLCLALIRPKEEENKE